jgi:glutathione synthase/RimK-type ligase-like ATP-grasp enzyme
VLQLIPGAIWINHPQANDIMECKPRQLLLASKIGFRIPETVITNDPGEARSLARKHGNKLIAKALYSPLIEEPDEDFFVFTNEIDATALVPEEVRISPSIFQQLLKPKVDYRVTVVGETVFPVRVENRGSGECPHIDWRAEKTELGFSACDLPLEIEGMCRRYVRTSGLIFGAIDLVEYGGEFFFLEINPNGEWGWLQRPHNIPIAEALCNLMISYDSNGKP